MNTNGIINTCIPAAILATAEHGFSKGTVLCHVSSQEACEFIEEHEGDALLSHVDGSIRRVPINEVFDPNILLRLAKTAYHNQFNKEINAALPDGVNAMTFRFEKPR